MAARSESPTRVGDDDASATQYALPDGVLARIEALARDGLDPVWPVDGPVCSACGGRDLVACGIFHRRVDEAPAREFQVALACRTCGTYARLDPAVVFRVDDA